MAAKVKWDRDAWWVITHYGGKRRKHRVGPTKAHKREAQQIAKKINAAIALGTFRAYPKTGRRDIGESRTPLDNLPPDEGESLAEAEEASAKLASFG